MGYTTDFVGHIDIHPALNEAEMAYLSAFRQSRRHDRPGGPYEVPMNPWAESSEGVDPDAYNRPAAGQPELWCQWEVCWDGCCLAFDGDEKFYRPLRWMEYLIDHFLRPGAHASTSGLVTFEEFTFDHVLDGMVIGCRRSDKELFAIDVEDNVVTRRLLAAGDEDYEGWPPLPYEEQIDRLAAGRASRKRRTRSDLRVVTSPE